MRNLNNLGRLYLAMRDDVPYVECAAPERGVCYVGATFVADAKPESAALVRRVIERWYHRPRE